MYTAVVWNSDGTATSLRHLGAVEYSIGLDINNHGQVVGSSNGNASAAEYASAALWSDEQVFNLNDLVNLSSLGNWHLEIATGINDNGLITGLMYYKVSFNYSVFLLTPDVTPSAVPLPAAVWLFGSALGGFGLMKRRKNLI